MDTKKLLGGQGPEVAGEKLEPSLGPFMSKGGLLAKLDEQDVQLSWLGPMINHIKGAIDSRE